MGPIAHLPSLATVMHAAWAAAQEAVGVVEVGVPLWLTVSIGFVTLAVGVLGVRGQLLKAFDTRATEMANRIILEMELRMRSEFHELEARAAAERALLRAEIAELRGQDQLAYLVNHLISGKLREEPQRGKDPHDG